MERINPQAPDFTDRNLLLEQLRAAVPEAFADGKLNPDLLQELLADDLTDDDARRETFGLQWTGKTNARRVAMRPPKGSALAPCPGEGINEDNTENIFIEGDNLEVLKLLRNAYAGRIKMIYIDPPYNTGKDFIYKDNFSESKDEYLEKSGQKVGDTFLVANPKSQGRFHSNWLNFIYPRIRIAKDLLTNDGVIFVSIDDNEVHNLKTLMNEIFGEENFVGQLVIINNLKGRNDKKNVATCHEYLLIYQKYDFVSLGLPLTEEQLKLYKFEDENGEKYALRDLRKRGGPDKREDRPNMFFPIFYDQNSRRVSLERLLESDIEILPKRSDGSDGRWRWGIDKVRENLSYLHPRYVKKSDKWNIDHRVYLNILEDIDEDDEFSESDENEDEGLIRTSKTKSFWIGGDVSTDFGKRSFKNILPKLDFDFPKSPELIKKCAFMSTKSGDIIMDFFAGSGTTGQAVIELNKETEIIRNFILVQVRDIIDPKSDVGKKANAFGIESISELTQERLKACCERYKSPINPGFKVLKLTSSAFRPWRDYTGGNVAQLKLAFEEQVRNPLVEGWQPAQLLTELLLLEGFPLHSQQEPYSGVSANNIIRVSSDFRAHRIFICLDEKIHNDTVDGLQTGKDDVFICFDSALSDLQKFKLDDRLKLKTI